MDLERALVGLEQRRGASASDADRDRLGQERRVIEARGWASWFRAGARVSDTARALGVVLRPDIGSWTASLTAYSLGLSGVDPVEWGSPFERMAERPGALLELAFGVSREAALRLLEALEREVSDSRPLDPKAGVGDGLQVVFPGDIRLALVFEPLLERVQAAVDAGLCLGSLDRNQVGRLGAQGLGPSCFEEAMAWVVLRSSSPAQDDALARLAVKRWDQYCHRGQRPATSLHPAADPVLAPTFGVLLYQEQTIELVRRVAGLGPADAYRVRCALGTGRSQVRREARAWFVHGAVGNGLSCQEASGLWEFLEDHALHTKGRAHVAADTLVALWVASAEGMGGHEPLAPS